LRQTRNKAEVRVLKDLLETGKRCGMKHEAERRALNLAV